MTALVNLTDPNDYDRSNETQEIFSRKVSRRDFLKISSRVAALTGVTYVITSCSPAQLMGEETPDFEVTPDQTFAYADNVAPPPRRIAEGILFFLTPHEFRTVEAFTARLLPGTPDDPGAREAGVARFIDVKLSKTGFWEPTYMEPPFAETFTGSHPPEQNGRFQQIWVAESEADRYGFQSSLTPRESYRMGLAALDRYANERLNANFVDLDEAQQDEIVSDLEQGDVQAFENPSAGDFFEMVRDDTIHGMFSDPSYGGNKDLVGWKLIGYPGPSRAFTPHELSTEVQPREPRTLDQLEPFHPGHDVNQHVLAPVSDDNPTNQMWPPGKRNSRR